MTARDPAEAYPAGRLWIDTDRWLPLQIELVDEQGNELSYRLSDIELDAALDDGLFTFEAPAGVELLRMER
jgi:outer membrane lipoprotein-sorting protein